MEVKVIDRHGDGWWEVLSLSRQCTHTIVHYYCVQSPIHVLLRRILAQPASQPAQTGAATICLSSSRFTVQLPGEATPHRNQPYHYFALLLPEL